MDYSFLDSSIDKDNIILPACDKINPILLKNNYADIIKAVDFIASDEKFLYIHGFMGTGKRQFINYICEFLNRDVIKLEYYCKEATVCDDILLDFNDKIDSNYISKAVNLNAKITTLGVKFHQNISSIKKPFLIILHSFDDVLEENAKLIRDCFSKITEEENVKLIVSTRGMNPSVMGDLEESRKIFLKALTKENFKEFLTTNGINAAQKTIEDFYKYTRGYYYYTALSVKIMQAMNIEIGEFLAKFNQSGMSFDSYLGVTYINLVPTAIRNFFWFLRTIRHGLTLNALAVLEVYDEFSIEYLKTNLMIFISDETVYVQDYFLQKIDISIPAKTQIKLHKYIIGIYEAQLKEPLKNRAIMISRQALRAEIEYHGSCIYHLEHGEEETPTEISKEQPTEVKTESVQTTTTVDDLIKTAQTFVSEKKFTDAISTFNKILDTENIDLHTVIETRLNLARIYKNISDYKMASHYYNLVELYYSQNKEFINLNYLYYEMTDLYYKMYKHERAIETIKKVIYSVDTPQSLMVNACIMLGNIYSDINNPEDAYTYYKKAMDSLEENVESETLAELYFKFALANDDRGEMELAFKYYNKCIALSDNNSYKALAYSNLGVCYFENENYDEARGCFQKAYDIEKSNNNYDGIYYNASYLAKIYNKDMSKRTLDYLMEAKKSAEFINEEFYILQATLAVGDYYYNNATTFKDALREYFKARNLALKISETSDINKIERRINDMKLRIKPDEFAEIEKRYGR